MTITVNGKRVDVATVLNNISDSVKNNERELSKEKLMSDTIIGGSFDNLEDNREIAATSQSEEEYVPSDKALFKKSLKEKYYSQKKLKFKKDGLYVIKAKNVPGLKFNKRIYKVVQIVWCLNDTVDLSSIVVKQVYGPDKFLSCLSQSDCQMLHIKYEPGLQIMSMYLNWMVYNKSNSDNLLKIK